MIVAHHDGAAEALDWLHKAGIAARDLDGDGKYFLLARQLELSRWNEARETVDMLNTADFEETPALHRLTGLAKLLTAVPTELRSTVHRQLPFQLADFPLAADMEAMEARRIAQFHFAQAVLVAKRLQCPIAAKTDEAYALWLELVDPVTTESGKERLRGLLRQTQSALHLVPLGFQFGISIDVDLVEEAIGQDIALHGKITPDAAIARLALALNQKTPADVATYIANHYEELSRVFDNKTVRLLEIEMLSRGGLPDRANELLGDLVEAGLPKIEENRIRRLISEAEGDDPVEVRRAQFKQSDSLSDLAALVDELERRGSWEELCRYSATLFERTRSILDAERFVHALSHCNRFDEILPFIESHREMVSQSEQLQFHYALALYDQGELLDSREELGRLSPDRDNPNIRSLRVNLCLALGEWNSLGAFVTSEYANREKRKPHDLILAAQLALNIGLPSQAKDLLLAATERAHDDAAVLAAAYFLASNAGWEGDERVVRWLHQAAELSGDDGPIQKVTLKEILERKPQWEKRQSEIWKLLSRGDIPIFLGAQSLNKSLLDLTLLPAFENLSEADPRRRTVIPALSGQRQITAFDLAGTKIGFDVTALLTLTILDDLESALGHVDTIYVPHSTLSWLFQEKQKACFHQPSRIRNAKELRDFVARELVETFAPTTVPDSDLAAQVGNELAELIAEAEKDSEGNDRQRIVVRSSPVHRLSSLLEEEADLSGHASVVSGCLPVIARLREKGQVTAEEEKNARAYLQLHEKQWPNQPAVQDGAILYLDDLAVTYFLHLKVLDRLKPAGFRTVVSASAIAEANALLAYERIADRALEAIERIRVSINAGIESGKVKLARRVLSDQAGRSWSSEHPTASITTLADCCDAIICDDRFINQHPNAVNAKGQAAILSSLDFLDSLVRAGAISEESRSEDRTLLRRAGYVFVPLAAEELAQHLKASTCVDGEIVETAELKAIRESILRIRMSDWLCLPREAPWLDNSFKVFIRVLKSTWDDEIDVATASARSDWLLDNMDVRGWVHSIIPENRDGALKAGRGLYILPLLYQVQGSSEVTRDAYFQWLEKRVIGPVKEQFPDLYEWLVEQQRKLIADLAAGEFHQVILDDE